MLVCLVFVAAVLFMLSAYAVDKLVVADIEVEGDSIYPAEDIEIATGIEVGERLLLIPFDELEVAMLEVMPYLKDVKVRPTLTSNLKITVEAEIEHFKVALPEGVFIVSDTYKILGRANPTHEGLPLIKGSFDIGQATGDTLSFNSEVERLVCVDILTSMKDNGMDKDISMIDITDMLNINVIYLDRFVIEMGDRLDVDAKLRFATASAAKLPTSAYGILDLSVEGQAIYKPTNAELKG